MHRELTLLSIYDVNDVGGRHQRDHSSTIDRHVEAKIDDKTPELFVHAQTPRFCFSLRFVDRRVVGALILPLSPARGGSYIQKEKSALFFHFLCLVQMCNKSFRVET